MNKLQEYILDAEHHAEQCKANLHLAYNEAVKQDGLKVGAIGIVINSAANTMRMVQDLAIAAQEGTNESH